MMIRLEKKITTSIPIEVEGVTPDKICKLDRATIATLPIWIGRESVALADLFDIAIENSTDNAITWSGDLTGVHWIGAGMESGEMIVESSAGRHLGSQMKGGTIHVAGSVSDFAGAEMRGGLIRIVGNAEDHLGGSYPGSKQGMNQGEILVNGSAGKGVGQRMRRGLIVVGGNTDKLCGWNMLAGTILVFGNCGADPGNGMKRGSIIQVDSNSEHVLPTFAPGGVYQGGFLGLLNHRLKLIEFPARFSTARKFQIHHGDQLQGGRGELLIGMGISQGVEMHRQAGIDQP